MVFVPWAWVDMGWGCPEGCALIWGVGSHMMLRPNCILHYRSTACHPKSSSKPITEWEERAGKERKRLNWGKYPHLFI